MNIVKYIRRKTGAVAVPRIDKGNCYYCDQPVYMSEGQLLKFLTVKSGKTVTEYPTHKKCRK